jgi:hypothetical protein
MPTSPVQIRPRLEPDTEDDELAAVTRLALRELV